MVGDMFNKQLKSKLDALCTDIVAHLERQRSQTWPAGTLAEVSYRSMSESTGLVAVRTWGGLER